MSPTASRSRRGRPGITSETASIIVLLHGTNLRGWRRLGRSSRRASTQAICTAPRGEFVEDSLQRGRDLILKPEVNGARAIKAAYPEAVLVFLTAPSTIELQRRLEQRQRRFADRHRQATDIAQEEYDALSQFDYRVINDDVEQAVSDLRAILTAERLKVARLPGRSG